MNGIFRTLPGLLKHIEANFRNECALGHKQVGGWEKISTARMGRTVRGLCLGLLEMGLKPGDKVGIVADPSPFWMMLDLAILSAGAVSVPMFANISSENLQYEISDSGMRFLFVGSAKQCEAMKPFFGSLEKIIALPADLEGGQDISFQRLLEMGERRMAADKDEYRRLSEAVGEHDTATLIYTSGSTGIPKGVELTHGNLVFHILGTAKRFPLDPAADIVLSCLPLAHVLEHMVCYYYLSTGASLYFAEDIKNVAADMRELRPTVITMVPRLLEKIHAKMRANVESATGLKKKLGMMAWQRAHAKASGSKQTLLDGFFDALVYKKMRAALGGNIRLLISGGAPLDPGIYAFLLNIGLPVYEGYGLTEASPVISANYPGHRKLGTVGPPFPGVEVKIGDDGEILTRGPHVMKGYYHKSEETAEAIDKQGWLHTGDLGHIDPEGFIKITGRKKELFKTANGKYVAPVPIEQALANKLADMVLVVAEGKPFTAALFFPDLDNLQSLKRELGWVNMDNAAFLRSDPAQACLQRAIDEVNAKLNHWEQVRKFYLANRPLSIGAGELTPTMKIRRHIVMEKYRAEIDAFYRS